MKICKKCGEITKDDSPICQNNNCYGNQFEDYEKVKNLANKKLALNEKIKKIISFSLFSIYSIIVGILIGINAFKGNLTLTLILGVLALIISTVICIRFTSKVFLITHIFSLNSVDENNMSDMYDTYIKIIGIALGIYSIFILIKPII